MKPTFPLLIISFLLIYRASAFCQQVQETTAPLFFEKAYLHTDRDVYGQGEDIWFKGYVVNAQNNTPINYSHNLYVELISPASKVVSREMIRLENGLGNGDFKLSDSIPAGHYRLRAYTNWMRNFGDNFIFEKNITLLQTADLNTPAATAAAKNRKKKAITTIPISTAIAPSAAQPVVRFYPEGGDLINNVSALIGVKAEDAAGNGIPISGRVVNNAGETISTFDCDSLGFGSFALLPVAGQYYQALAMLQGKEQRFILPEIQQSGYALHVRYLGLDTLKVMISSSASTPGQHLYLVARHGGKSYVRQAIVLNKSNATITIIPNNQLPEGITAITLYDEQNNPQCERLVYIHHSDHDIINKVSIHTDKESYQPKGQVMVTIKSSPNSHLSLAAVDAGTVPVQPENIVSYLNLQSEIRGTIEQPNRYFDTMNINRARQLDLLLLTQGWRGFVWKKLADTTLQITYQPEQGITLTGRVRRVGVNKPLPGIDITMRAPKAEGQKLFWATTDSTGRFAIYDTKFYGYQYLSFTSRKSNKINRNGDSKGDSGGYIQVDSLLKDTLTVRQIGPMLPIDTSWRSRQREDAAIEQIKKNLKLKADHNLKEVTIKAHTSRLVTKLPPEIHPITLAEQKDYDNLEQYLLYMVEGAEATLYNCSGCMSDPESSPFIPILRQKGKAAGYIMIHATYADKSAIYGCPCQNEYLDLPMSNVFKVTINRIEDVYGKHISVDVILRPGVLDTKDYFDNTVADMTGYYKARIFYKPNIEKPNDIDLRTNTIHWEPNITTDSTGEATVTFYNIEQTGKIRLMAEGINPSGTPLVSTAIYEVK